MISIFEILKYFNEIFYLINIYFSDSFIRANMRCCKRYIILSKVEQFIALLIQQNHIIFSFIYSYNLIDNR